MRSRVVVWFGERDMLEKENNFFVYIQILLEVIHSSQHSNRRWKGHGVVMSTYWRLLTYLLCD